MKIKPFGNSVIEIYAENDAEGIWLRTFAIDLIESGKVDILANDGEYGDYDPNTDLYKKEDIENTLDLSILKISSTGF